MKSGFVALLLVVVAILGAREYQRYVAQQSQQSQQSNPESDSSQAPAVIPAVATPGKQQKVTPIPLAPASTEPESDTTEDTKNDLAAISKLIEKLNGEYSQLKGSLGNWDAKEKRLAQLHHEVDKCQTILNNANQDLDEAKRSPATNNRDQFAKENWITKCNQAVDRAEVHLKQANADVDDKLGELAEMPQKIDNAFQKLLLIQSYKARSGVISVPNHSYNKNEVFLVQVHQEEKQRLFLMSLDLESLKTQQKQLRDQGD